MSTTQKIIKYLAIALAIFLLVGIIEGFLGVLGALGRLFSNDTVEKDIKSYTISSEIHSLELQIGAAELRIEEGDCFSVTSNLKNLTVKESQGVLKIKERGTVYKSYLGAVMTVYIPKDALLENVDITTGAGRVTVTQLSAERLHWVLGAGQAEVQNLTVTRSADIHGGTGEITISDGALRDLELEMGIGQLNLCAALTGESELSLGIGESNITVIGDKNDYQLDIEKGLGEMTLDGMSIGNIKEYGNGIHSIEISGGIGAVYISFAQAR